MRSKLLMVLGAAALVAGCTAVDPGFGEALKYDMAAQTIDPDPVYPPEGAKPGSSGAKAAKASENYRKGTTKALREERTSNSGSSGPQ